MSVAAERLASYGLRGPCGTWSTRLITKADLNWWFDLEPELDWQFATTYADGAPHEYVAEGRVAQLDHADFVRAAHVIRTFGEPMKFYKWTRIYLVTPMGWKHWTMADDLGATTLVNRGRVEHVYGVQNQPCTASGIVSAYDSYASTWDAEHGMTDEERAATVELTRATFGEKLWRTLDVGCGTGVPLDLGLAEPVRYVSIDPSTAMLNTLVAKYPDLAGIHPMTYVEAERRRVLCGTVFDTVLALGGSASYLAPEEIEQLRARAKRAVVLMHYAPDQNPITCDLNAERARSSFDATTHLAASQTTIGRFVASVIPA